MRWERLFDDLSAQAAELAAGELAGEVAERSRAEAGRVPLVDRLRAVVDQRVELAVLGAGPVDGELRRVGRDWLLLVDPRRRELMVALAALLSVSGLRRQTAGAAPAGDLDLRKALRGVAKDRTPVTIILIDGTAYDGTLDRVGADYVELAEHPIGEPRRVAAVRGVRALPLAAVAMIRAG